MLQARLGHASMDMTANTYMHLLPGATRQAAKALSDTVMTNRRKRGNLVAGVGLNGSKKGAKKEIARPR